MSQVGRVGMWRGGGRIGLSVSAPFVWRCLNSRADYSVSTPRSSNRTGAINSSGSRTRHHAFAHGRSRAAIRPTARAVIPQRTSIDPIVRNRQCHHLGDRGSLVQLQGSPFASACGAFRNSRTSSEFNRVAPISCALPLPAPALNQGPFPPPALPGLLSNTGLSATP